MRILGADKPTEVHIARHRDGWADLDALANDEVTTGCPQITTPEKSGTLLDTATTGFLDTGQSTTT